MLSCITGFDALSRSPDPWHCSSSRVSDELAEAELETRSKRWWGQRLDGARAGAWAVNTRTPAAENADKAETPSKTETVSAVPGSVCTEEAQTVYCLCTVARGWGRRTDGLDLGAAAGGLSVQLDPAEPGRGSEGRDQRLPSGRS